MELLALLLIFLAFTFYFIPTAIAHQRRAQHFTGIFLINLVFGWTVLGWIAALIWAIVEKTDDLPQIPPGSNPAEWRGAFDDHIDRRDGWKD